MKTLDELRKKQENKGDFQSGPKREFLTLNSGDSYTIRFRQELAEDGKNYSEDAGTASFVAVHKNPLNFKKRAACTKDSEEHNFHCWACEQIAENNKWRSQQRMFVNVAVFNPETKEWEAKIFEQGFGKSHIVNDLIEYAAVYGSVVDREYKLKRTGGGLNDTAYSLIPMAEGPENKDVKKLDLLTFEGLVKVLPYEEQEAFYYDKQVDPAKSW